MNPTALRTIAASAAFAVATGAATSANAGTIALYTFENGGAIGSAVSTIPNAASPGAYTATGIQLGTDTDGWGDAPCWTNNFPGNCVFSNSECTNVIARAPMAAHIATNANAKLGGALDMSGLASALYATNSFTVEFFWRQGEVVKPGVIMSMIHGYILNVGSSSKTQTGVQMDGKSGYSLPTEIHCGSSTDKRYLHKYGWRHWAVTFDKATSTATLWFDYENYGSLTDGFGYGTTTSGDLRFGSRRYSDKPLQGFYGAAGEISCIRVSGGVLGVEDYWNAWSDLPFVVGLRANLTEGSGNRGFVGKISSVRITSKALAPERFMVASDTASAPSTDAGFRWRFEDGAVGSTVGTAADSASGEKWAIGEVTTYGTGWTTPRFLMKRWLRRRSTHRTHVISSVPAAASPHSRATSTKFASSGVRFRRRSSQS